MTMKNDIENKIDHILVSLRLDSYSTLIMRQIVVLAEKLNANLCGMFVEDSDLLSIASLPFSREVVFPAANVRKLDSAAMLRQMHSHAEKLRQMMAEYARLSNVACSFRTAAGSVIEKVLGESSDFQLIILVPEKYSSRRKVQAENTGQLINPVVLFYDGSSQAKKSVRVIHSLIENNDLRHLKVLTTHTDYELSARQYLKLLSVKVDFIHIDHYSINDIISMFSTDKPGLMILPLEKELMEQGRDIKYLLDTLSCVLLLVR